MVIIFNLVNIKRVTYHYRLSSQPSRCCETDGMHTVSFGQVVAVHEYLQCSRHWTTRSIIVERKGRFDTGRCSSSGCDQVYCSEVDVWRLIWTQLESSQKWVTCYAPEQWTVTAVLTSPLPAQLEHGEACIGMSSSVSQSCRRQQHSDCAQAASPGRERRTM